VCNPYIILLLVQTAVVSPVDPLGAGAEGLRQLIMEVTSSLNSFKEEVRDEIARLDSRLDDISHWR
jgi:hypothetical protein